jgi:asparagine synthase (glutamine-hydrolysing)
VCGIFGGLALRRQFEAETRTALHALAHRGPDGEGLVALGDAVLGHRRLSIIDLSSAADQPLWDVRKQIVIVFNGEIYNYRELRAECVAAGLEFGSESDTEVIVNQYRVHGARAFDRLNGMFAFALYDSRSGDAYLVRDHFGIKPLYFAQTAQGTYFSSELQALLPLPGVDAAIDPTALQAYLQLDFVPTPYTIVKGVKKLDSGSYLRVARDGRHTVERFYERKAADVPEHEALPELARRLDAAVRRHLISDVPLGVFLSGGIDSSLVADSAHRLKGAISTFSIAFDDPSFDESQYFGEVSRALGTDHHTKTLSAAAMIELVPQVARWMGEPLADGSIYPTYLLARFAREHVTVALSGDGADELFAGYPTYFAHAISRTLPSLVTTLLGKSATAAHRFLPVSYANLSTDFKLKKFLDGMDADLIRRHMRWMGTFPAESLPHLLISYDSTSQRELDLLFMEPARQAGGRWLEELLRTDQRFYLQDGVLVKADRATMASSLEVRVPFLDREMIALADGLKPSMKLRGRTTKVSLRQLASERFPPRIAKRPKKGFGVPLGLWFRGELKSWLRDTLSMRRVEERGFFKPPYVEQLLQDHWNGRRDNRKQIFNILSFSLWYDQFGKTR